MGASVSQTGLSQAEPEEVSALRASIPRAADMRAWRMLERIVGASHSHIDGRDLFAELHPRKTLDIKRRVDGRETWHEGDWLSGLWDAVKEARALLYTKGQEQAITYRNTGSPEAARSASAMSAGTAETTEIGSGLQPASAVAKPGAQMTPSNSKGRECEPKKPLPTIK